MAGKFIVVTGGTQGIGRAIIEKFLDRGFDVATCSRNPASLERLQQEMNARENESKIWTFQCDLSLADQSHAFVQHIRDLKRPVDILVNNTGSFTPGLIIEEDEGVLENLMAQNVYSAYHVTRGLVGDMISRRSGHIFNMCSIASILAYPNGGSYTISKFALLGFSRSLREELKAFGVKVTAVLPGATLTASWEGTDLPESRFIKPGDVADAVYAASSLSENSVVEELLIRPQLGDI